MSSCPSVQLDRRSRRAIVRLRRNMMRSPQFWLLGAILTTLAVAEAAVMLFLHLLPPMVPWHEGMLDGLLLALLVSPVMYWLVHRVAAQLKSQEADRLAARITAILAHTIDGVVVTDATGNIVTFNRGAEQIFGYTSAEIVGRSVVALIPDRFAGRHAGQMQRFLHGSVNAQALGERGVLTGRHKSGCEIPVEISIAKAEAAGETTMIAIVRDVSERHRIETELRLEKDRAETAARAKSDFLANMSHEIRTPMNAVIGLTDLLLDSSLDAEQRSHLETIRVSGDSLLVVINDILDFSKIESGHLELETAPFDVRQCVESALDLVAPRAAQKRLDLVQSVDDDVPELLVGDVTRVRQVLVNLLGNAVKFTEQGEVFLQVRLGAKGGDVAQLQMSVRDTGLGISPENQSRLFQSFCQADNSTTRRFGGTGLGLAICKRLVELMGGRIWVESELGRGATFHFTFQLPVGTALEPAGSGSSMPGRRFLVVDDNSTNRRILSHQLGRWGAEVVSDACAADALHRVESDRRFDAVLLDLYMPDMDGIALAAALQQQWRGAMPPFVLLSSVGSHLPNDTRERFAAVISKPVKSAQLRRTLGTVLGDTMAPAAPDVRLDQSMATQFPLRVLLAEDNPVNTAVAKSMLARIGYRVTAVGNGVEVLDAVRRAEYDVILMDMQMPEMDGLTATRRLRSTGSGAGPRPYVVAMTANVLEADRRACREAGMDDFLPKPTRPADLQAVLRRAACHGAAMTSASS